MSRWVSCWRARPFVVARPGETCVGGRPEQFEGVPCWSSRLGRSLDAYSLSLTILPFTA